MTQPSQPGKPECTPTNRAALELGPFRALRYDPSRVRDLAAVTAPPYDVIDDDALDALREQDPHNVVRLIRPGAPAGEPQERRYDAAARTLEAWRAEGVLVQDREPALYVYEQRTERSLQRGLVGALGVRHPREGVVLPHEDVMPGPVADRLELMRATRANLEPILLSVDDAPATDEVVHRSVAGAPLIDVTTRDGVRHRVWAVVDAGDLDTVAADLAGRQALIADGHHRYATYRRLQAEHHAAGDGAGPWDRGLALLVDTARYPLAVGAIHRAVAGLRVEEAARKAAAAMQATPLDHDLAEGLARLEAAHQHGSALLAVDDESMVLLSEPNADVLDACMPPEHSEQWRRLDAAVAHHVLIEGVWDLGDEPRRVSYHHDLDAALRSARRTGGLALLLNPVPVDEVAQIAAFGERMPRKSTSFSPKPLTGLLMRLLDED